MAFLAADPWGTAMLAAAAIVVLALFVFLAALFTGTPKRAAARILGVGCFLFLGTAAGGTWERIVAADKVAADAAVQAAAPKPVKVVALAPPPEVGEAGGSSGGAAPVETASADDADSPASETGDADADAAAETGEPEAPQPETPEPETPEPETPEPETPEPETPQPASGADPLGLAPSKPADIATDPVTVATPAALPTEPEARKKAISAVLRAARNLAADDTQCGDALAVAEAWLTVKALPAGTSGARTATSRLEGCRKRIKVAKAYWIRRQRVAARNAYGEELPGKLKVDESYVFVNLRGKVHERIRIGGTSITEARVKALIAAGLDGWFKSLGFAEVTFASGRSNKTYKYEGGDDAALIDAVMARHGIAEPFKLDAP